METRTPVAYTTDNGISSSSRGRHGCVVLCGRDGVQINIGSSSNLSLQPPHYQHHHHPHQFQQQQDADITQEQATRDADEIHQRARSPPRHVQASAPGQQTLLRPWSGSSIPRNGPHMTHQDQGEDNIEKQPVETVRPPPFNPDCSMSTSKTRLADCVEPSTGVKSADDTYFNTSATGDGQNALPPPSYDEIYGDEKDHHYQNHHQQQHHEQLQHENSFQTSSVTRTTTDDSAVFPSSLQCVAKFGHYTTSSTHHQPGWFTHPTRISVRASQADQPESPAVIVIDQSSSTVHVFTSTGDCLSLLRVPQVNGGCLIGQHPTTLLLLAVGISVSVYEVDGRFIKEIPLRGRQQDDVVLTAVPYGERGFVAVRSRSLSICRGGIIRPAVVHTLAGRYRVDRGTTPFINVVDVAVNSRRGQLVVLDAANPTVSSHRTAVYVMTEDGAVLRAIRPAHDAHCGAMLHPSGVTIDQSGNVLVSDGGRLVQFSDDDGRYLGTLVGDDTTTQPPQRRDGIRVGGVAVGSIGGQQVLFTVLTGIGFAQIQAFALQS